MVLDRAKAKGIDEFLPHGIRCLTVSVLSIIITAPMGAILMSSLGPKWLTKSDDLDEDDQGALEDLLTEVEGGDGDSAALVPDREDTAAACVGVEVSQSDLDENAELALAIAMSLGEA